MTPISYDGRSFRIVSNSGTGESGSQTIFHYRQKGRVVWGTYRGGNIVLGTLLAKVGRSGRLEMSYQHLNKNGDFMAGRCTTRLEVLPDGRYRLHEKWQWTTGDESSGASLAEEFIRRKSPRAR